MLKHAKGVVAVLLLAALAGCGTPGSTGPAMTSEDALLSASSLNDNEQATTAGLVDQLMAEMADDADKAPTVTPPPSGPRGSLMYRAFNGSQVLRRVGYAVADGIVRRHFSKPGKADSVPALTAEQVSQLKATLQPGDVIQCGNNDSFVHAIFYLGQDRIVHSLAQAGFGKKMIGVRAETLSEYLARVERDKVVVLRPHWTADSLAKATTYAQSLIGHDYDTLFMTDSDDRVYCTELIYNVLTRTGTAKVTPHQTKLGWRLVTNEDLRKSADLDVVLKINHD